MFSTRVDEMKAEEFIEELGRKAIARRRAILAKAALRRKIEKMARKGSRYSLVKARIRARRMRQ